jgi:Domain of unknown function (DUF1929)/Glyoxal oxidase N-terminus/Galactose oxidase, central domain
MGRFTRTIGVKVAASFLLAVAAAVVVSSSAALAGPMDMLKRFEERLAILDETDAKAPVDFGPGPGEKPIPEVVSHRVGLARTMTPAKNQIPLGGPEAKTTGVFGAPVAWPIIPIHALVLPDGRIMNYGSDTTGAQGSKLVYDVWTPTLGTGTNAHTVLPNTTSTDIFCSAQSLLPSGDVLAAGGDLTVNGVRNSAINSTTIFSPTANTLTTNTPMTYARWYGSLVSLPNGQLAIFGGRQNVGSLAPPEAAPTPELYDPASKSWTVLTGATSISAFGSGDWYYPRSFLAPGGQVFVLAYNGWTYYVSTAGVGSITKAKAVAPVGDSSLPTVPFAPGKLLSLRLNQQVVVVDYTTATPIVTPTDNMDQVRFWASGTVMADGRVLINGGSAAQNVLTGVAYQAQIWDPATGHWTAGASAVKARLYHSNALLLPDATVLTGGGGAPGPVKNLNSEIYYPPYLYAASGAAARRPVISAIASTFVNPGDTLNITVGATDIISHLTFIRTGSATHSFNTDQRFINLVSTQEGQNVTAVLPTDNTTLLPGYYMLFAFSAAGVPSVATIVNVM